MLDVGNCSCSIVAGTALMGIVVQAVSFDYTPSESPAPSGNWGDTGMTRQL